MTTIELVRLDQLVEDPDNPRVEVGDVSDLATSIKNLGLQQALRVRKLDDGNYAVVAGSRRHAAMNQAKLPSDYMVPVTVTTDNGSSSTLTGLVENAQRKGLTRWEQADAFARLVTEFGMKQKQISQLTGFDASLVSRRVALAKLSQAARDAVDRVTTDSNRFNDPDTLARIARDHHKVADEIWSVISTPSDLDRMCRAQELLAVRDRISSSPVLTVDEPVVADFNEVDVPKGHELIQHEKRAVQDIADIKLQAGDTGVVRQYSRWVPITIAEKDVEATQAVVDERKAEREAQREARRRSAEARRIWFQQWIDACNTMSLSAAREIVLNEVIRQAHSTHGSRSFIGPTVINTIGNALDWTSVDGLYTQAWRDAVDAKNGMRILALAVVVNASFRFNFTGKVTDTKNDLASEPWLETLANELNIEIPKVR